jgi:pilus assembly protein CpaE
MHSKLSVLIASRSKQSLADVATLLEEEARFELRSRHIENGHADPLYGLDFVPDIVVLALTDRGHADLTELANEVPAQRPPMIVLAEHGDAQTMRLAMQAGARDFLPGALRAEDLMASIDRAAAQRPKAAEDSPSNLIAVVNAKGGGGATFIASNVAHILCQVSRHSTALLSLDMQFESLAQYFDLTLKHDLMELLENVGDVDAVSLDAYMTQHASGLRFAAAKAERSFDSKRPKTAELELLLDKMATQYERIVVDMPRRVDGYTKPVLDRATRVVLVVQQTLSHLHDASRMLQIFGHHGVHNDQVLVVVNRFEKNSPISLDDVKRATNGIDVISIPSDFKTVAESINVGVPMYEHAKGSAVTKGLEALAAKLGGRQIKKTSNGMFSRAISNLLRKEAP